MPKNNANNGGDEEYTLKTHPFDPRFPQCNQTYACFYNYVDYHRCLDLLRENPGKCDYFKKVYETLCPNAWVSHWDDMRENGTFPNPIIRVRKPGEDERKKKLSQNKPHE